MAKQTSPPSFNDALASLAGHQFDVSAARHGSSSSVKAYQVRKFGCAAIIAAAADGSTLLLERPGWLLNGAISCLLDRGFQKFLKTDKLEIPATADHLHAIHNFSQDLYQDAGATTLYNESLGTTSDRYLYDRLMGRH